MCTDLNCVKTSWNSTRISSGAWQCGAKGKTRETVLKLHFTKLRKCHQLAISQDGGGGGMGQMDTTRAGLNHPYLLPDSTSTPSGGRYFELFLIYSSIHELLLFYFF